MDGDYKNPYITGNSLESSIPSFELNFDKTFMAGDYAVFYLPHYAKAPDGAIRINQNLGIYAIKSESVIIESKSLNDGFGRGEIICTRIENVVAGVFKLVNETHNMMAIAVPSNLVITGSARNKVVKLNTPNAFLDGYQVFLIPTGEYHITMYHTYFGLDFVKNATTDTEETEGVKA